MTLTSLCRVVLFWEGRNDVAYIASVRSFGLNCNDSANDVCAKVVTNNDLLAVDHITLIDVGRVS